MKLSAIPLNNLQHWYNQSLDCGTEIAVWQSYALSVISDYNINIAFLCIVRCLPLI